MIRRLPEALIPPLAIVVVAALVAATALFVRPEPKAVLVPVDLRTGAVQTLEFKANYSKPHRIGIEMDQEVARRLFPCMVDASAPSFGRCKPDEFPLVLSLALVTKGADSPNPIQSVGLGAGGRYVGRDTFTRDVGFTRLSAGTRYQLTVRSLADGTALAAAHPRLVVEVHPLDLKGDALMRGLAVIAAAALVLVGGVWAAVVLLLRRIRPARAARA